MSVQIHETSGKCRGEIRCYDSKNCYTILQVVSAETTTTAGILQRGFSTMF